jgi:guanylate kinase
MSSGLLLVVSAPSGAGKSTLCQALTDRRSDVRLSISCTTRAPRPSEKDGREYYFLSDAEFDARRERGEFLEWARVHGHSYGTPRAALETQIARGLNVVMDIDTQGAFAVKKSFPASVLVFVAPPSWEELEQRLRRRRQDDEATIRRRLANARMELAQAARYDYLIVNNDLEEAVGDLLAILRAETRRVARLKAEMATLEFFGA